MIWTDPAESRTLLKTIYERKIFLTLFSKNIIFLEFAGSNPGAKTVIIQPERLPLTEFDIF